jgi:tetratricopeptide (TPR) repeat protein
MILQTSTLWNIQLFGGLKVFAVNGTETITRFRSQRYAALLAYLALFPSRQHSREELADMLWPDADTEAARTYMNPGNTGYHRGDLTAAQSLLDEFLHLLQETEDKYGLGVVWEDLGLLAVEKGDLRAASALFLRSLKMRQENGERMSVAFTLQNLGLLLVRQKKPAEAVRFLGAASVLCEELGSPLPPQQQRRQDTVLPALSASLDEAGFNKVWESGRALSMAEAVALALETMGN